MYPEREPGTNRKCRRTPGWRTSTTAASPATVLKLRLALLKTHYYGGIKKYQWVNIPLAIHGRVVTAKGKQVDVCIGEDPKDPVFTITDLEPHLYRKKQARRPLEEGIKGEELNVLGSSVGQRGRSSGPGG